MSGKSVGHPFREPCWESIQSEPVSRYFSSLRTMDESLQALFDALNQTGELDNTIVIGAGDHGETPGMTKRLEDTDATILRVPLWMHIPKSLLLKKHARRERKQKDQQMHSRMDPEPMYRAKKNETDVDRVDPPLVSEVLRSNAHQSVSTLDIVPTLRDILNFPRLFTPHQKATCVTGLSLAKEKLSNDRLAVGWGGSPLAGVSIATFATKTQALLVCPKDMDRTRLAHLHQVENGDDPFYRLHESRWDNLDNPDVQRRYWYHALHEQGWLSHDFVKLQLPDLVPSEDQWSEFWGFSAFTESSEDVTNASTSKAF